MEPPLPSAPPLLFRRCVSTNNVPACATSLAHDADSVLDELQNWRQELAQRGAHASEFARPSTPPGGVPGSALSASCRSPAACAASSSLGVVPSVSPGLQAEPLQARLPPPGAARLAVAQPPVAEGGPHAPTPSGLPPPGPGAGARHSFSNATHSKPVSPLPRRSASGAAHRSAGLPIAAVPVACGSLRGGLGPAGRPPASPIRVVSVSPELGEGRGGLGQAEPVDVPGAPGRRSLARPVSGRLAQVRAESLELGILGAGTASAPNSGASSPRCLSSFGRAEPMLLDRAWEEQEANGQEHTSKCKRLTDGQAGVQLFLRLHHARQTKHYVQQQISRFCTSSHAMRVMKATVWDALNLLDELREYEAVLLGQVDADASLGLRAHAIQSAELCRVAFPDQPALHLAGLLHSLGKLLAHERFGRQPQWSVCGESFPVGAAFAPSIIASEYLSANPDQRRPLYRSMLGEYTPGCGLDNLDMSWGAAEYIYTILLLNGCAQTLPADALFVLRYQKFFSLTRHGAYTHFLSDADSAKLPMLRRFQSIIEFRKQPVPGGARSDADIRAYYDALIARYLVKPTLHF